MGNVDAACDKSVSDIAKHFGVGDKVVRKETARPDGIPHRRIGGQIRYNLAEVDEWARNEALERLNAA